MTKEINRGKIILEGICGSQAHGTATEDSDIDKHGVFIYDTVKILTDLSIATQTFHSASGEEDTTYHELSKFVGLAVKCNPSIIELLFLQEFTILHGLGKKLVDIRWSFLNSKYVRDAYLGYAGKQVYKLKKRESEGRVGFSSKTSKRYAKHARHCFRLLEQCEHILLWGDLEVKVKDKEFLEEVGTYTSEQIESEFLRKKEKIDNIIYPAIPKEPDIETIKQVLYDIRFASLAERIYLDAL